MLRFSVTVFVLFVAFLFYSCYLSNISIFDPLASSKALRFASAFALISVCFATLEDTAELSWPLYLKTVQFNYDIPYVLGACLLHSIFDCVLDLGPYETATAVCGLVLVVCSGYFMLRVPQVGS